MVSLLRPRGSTRRIAQAGFQYWRNWFVVTFIALLCLRSLSSYQDAGGSELLLQQETRDLSERDGDYLPKEIEATSKRKHEGSLEAASLRQDKINVKSKTSGMPEEEVYFLNGKNLSHHDGFSASWLLTKDDFLTLPFDEMHSCEMTAFRAYDGPRLPKMRMTLDWMQFSVEHLSKWWKTAEWDQNEIVYHTIIQQLQKYLDGAKHFAMEDQPFQETIAVLAFQSYKSELQPEQAHKLTAMALAATLESLRRASFGRAVVAMLVPQDIPVVEDGFKYFAGQFDSKETTPVTKVGGLEVGYAYANKAYIKTSLMMKNMPRATVTTLRDAFLHSTQPELERTEDMRQNITAWLGDTHDASYWKYVYLTEPDSLLQFRPSAMPAIKAEIDKGNVMLPHRWQPVPHESDLRGMNKTDLFLTEQEFPEVLDLDPIHSHDACCDENKGRGFKPGMPPFYDFCGKRMFWYACGFYGKKRREADKHRRLKPYKLLRLLGGSEITTIAGSEHARRCHPKKGGLCRPDDVYDWKGFFDNFDDERRQVVDTWLVNYNKWIAKKDGAKEIES